MSHKKKQFTLVDALVYMCVTLVVVSMAVKAYVSATKNSEFLRYAANDIVVLGSVGDQWRETIHQADTVLLLEKSLSIKMGKNVNNFMDAFAKAQSHFQCYWENDSFSRTLSHSLII